MEVNKNKKRRRGRNEKSSMPSLDGDMSTTPAVSAASSQDLGTASSLTAKEIQNTTPVAVAVATSPNNSKRGKYHTRSNVRRSEILMPSMQSLDVDMPTIAVAKPVADSAASSQDLDTAPSLIATAVTSAESADSPTVLQPNLLRTLVEMSLLAATAVAEGSVSTQQFPNALTNENDGVCVSADQLNDASSIMTTQEETGEIFGVARVPKLSHVGSNISKFDFGQYASRQELALGSFVPKESDIKDQQISKASRVALKSAAKNVALRHQHRFKTPALQRLEKELKNKSVERTTSAKVIKNTSATKPVVSKFNLITGTAPSFSATTTSSKGTQSSSAASKFRLIPVAVTSLAAATLASEESKFRLIPVAVPSLAATTTSSEALTTLPQQKVAAAQVEPKFRLIPVVATSSTSNTTSSAASPSTKAEAKFFKIVGTTNTSVTASQSSSAAPLIRLIPVAAPSLPATASATKFRLIPVAVPSLPVTAASSAPSTASPKNIHGPGAAPSAA